VRRVIIESPYGNTDKTVVEANVEYARRCIRDSLARGEAPIASHLLYTQPGILNDDVPTERAWGIAAGLAWGAVADATVVYLDRGLSGGMKHGIARAVYEKRNVDFRSIYDENVEANRMIRKILSGHDLASL
jgi:hypothetical protein